MKTLIAAVALAAASPAFAQDVSGPVDSSIEDTKPVLTDAEIRRKAIKMEHNFVALRAFDTFVGCAAVQGATEATLAPYLGKNVSCAKYAGFNAATTAVQYLAFKHLLKRDPKAAHTMAALSFGLSAIHFTTNIRLAF
jgi:hypothetical protein